MGSYPQSDPLFTLWSAGGGNIIHTDLGLQSAVEPGQVLTVYRDNGDLPRLMIGQAVVLTVETTTSTAKIVQAVRETEGTCVSVEEAASVLGLSRATAYREWSFARAWLATALGENS